MTASATDLFAELARRVPADEAEAAWRRGGARSAGSSTRGSCAPRGRRRPLVCACPLPLQRRSIVTAYSDREGARWCGSALAMATVVREPSA